MKGFALTLPIIFLLSACNYAEQDTTALQSEIERASARLWTAHQNANADSLAAVLAEDAIIMIPNMPDLQGRDQIRESTAQSFAAMRISDFNIVTREITVCGNTAFELATYTETLTFTGKQPQSVSGRYLLVWKRQSNGSWLVHRNLFNFSSPSS